MTDLRLTSAADPPDGAPRSTPLINSAPLVSLSPWQRPKAVRIDLWSAQRPLQPRPEHQLAA